DRNVMPALDLFLRADCDAVVAQIVEPELGVGTVSDVAVILLAPDVGRLVVENATNCDTQEAIDGAHPLTVTSSQVIVHGHYMNTAGGERIQVNGQCRDERFAFA